MSDLTLQWLSIVVLVVLFVLATARPINLGALGLVAALGVGVLLASETVDDVVAGFPADIFLLLLGVTYLFAIATVNGTIETIVDWVAVSLRGNRAVLPWVMFLLAMIPTTAGAAGPAGIALLAPLAMTMAKKYRIPSFLAALMVLNGSDAGNFSPLNVLGVIVNGTLDRNGLEVSETALWLANLVVKSTGAPNAAPANVARPPAPIPATTQSVGARRVASVQRALTQYGYGQLKPTGAVGADTQAAITKFERDRKLPVTGQMSDRLVKELTAMIGHPID